MITKWKLLPRLGRGSLRGKISLTMTAKSMQIRLAILMVRLTSKFFKGRSMMGATLTHKARSFRRRNSKSSSAPSSSHPTTFMRASFQHSKIPDRDIYHLNIHLSYCPCPTTKATKFLLFRIALTTQLHRRSINSITSTKSMTFISPILPTN